MLKIISEGREAFHQLNRQYSYEINPYKDSIDPWLARHWQRGFQEAYMRCNPSHSTDKSPSAPDWNLRSEGEDDHIDRYFNRGL